ncbi:MAG: hypothetical protein LBT40_16655 [Deltaproteobacteria bacterium]|jgi:hypothetical protein|nr:hypothetical protein [Deltaproteobacteria bacterium]
MDVSMVMSVRPREGLALLGEAADASAERPGREEPRTLTARTAVGVALAHCRRRERAVEVSRDVLAVAERLGSWEGAMVAEARASLRRADELLGGLG